MKLRVDQTLSPGMYDLAFSRANGEWQAHVEETFDRIVGSAPDWVGNKRPTPKPKAPIQIPETDRTRVEAFLLGYEGTNEFLLSCQSFAKAGTLTDRQVAAIAANNLP